MPESKPTTRLSRFRFQYSLRTMFIVVTLLLSANMKNYVLGDGKCYEIGFFRDFSGKVGEA